MVITRKNNRILVRIKYFESKVIKDLGGIWSVLDKGWTFPLDPGNFWAIVNSGKESGHKIRAEKELVDLMRKDPSEVQPPEMYPYQKDSLEILKNHDKFFLNGEVGTGKSKICIELIKYRHIVGQINKCLVVSPASIIRNFENEVYTHSNLTCTSLTGTKTQRIDKISQSKSVIDIINYEMLDKLQKEIISKGYDMIVFDEVHKLKSRSSIQSKAAYKIVKDIKYRLGMTGTLINNTIEDVFMPFKVINSAVFGQFFIHFKNEYLITRDMTTYHIVIGERNSEKFKDKLARNCITIKLRDVINDLPEETEIEHKITLKPSTMKSYIELKNNMIADFDGKVLIADNILERLIRLSQITSGLLMHEDEIELIGSEKIDALKEILMGINEKTVIFCRFTTSIDRVAKLCKEIGKKYYIFDGRTKSKDKDCYLRFNNDDTDVFIAQIQKSEGYSLRSAKYCIFYEMDYSRKNHIQSKGRILRASGSDHNTIIYMYLLAEKTIDEVIKDILKKKDFNAQEAMEYVRRII